jgi:hypothetical protein
MTCAHNLAYKAIGTDKEYKKSEEIRIYLGKLNNESVEEMVNSGFTILLEFNEEDILFSPNYKENQPGGYDIALLGLSYDNNLKL